MTNIGHDDRSPETRRGKSVGAADIACFLSARRSAAPTARAPRPIVGDKHPVCASVNGAQTPEADPCPASRPSVAANGAADRGAVGAGGGGLQDDPALRHHQQAVGELQQFVAIFAHQQNRRAAVAGGDNLAVDVGDGGEIEAENRIGGDQDAHLAAEFARQRRSLDGAARKSGDRRVRPRRRDLVAADQGARRLPHRAAREPEAARGSRPCAKTPSDIPGSRRSRSSSFSLPAAPKKRSRQRVDVTMPVRFVTRSIKTSGDMRLDDRRIRKFDAPLAFGMSRRLSRALWRRPRLAANLTTEQI